MSILAALQQDQYRIGDLQAIVYDRKRTDAFPPGFLSHLYFAFLGNRYNKRDGTGILEMMLCGFEDFSHDAVVDFWLHHALSVLGIWRGEEFEACGICFPALFIGGGQEEHACYGGYGFLRKWWGTDELEVLSMLGIAQMFVEMNLLHLHGSRLIENDLTAKFMARFGFKDLATLPAQMTRQGKLVPATISTLSRADFEQYVERQVLETFRTR